MSSWLSVDYERESLVFRLPDGTPVYTNYTFGVIALLVTAPLFFQGRPAGIITAALLIAIMYLSILAHEFGHKAAARRQQADTTSIEIGFYGGLAHLEWDLYRGIAMRPIAFAGPAVNLALAGSFYALYWLLTRYGGADVPADLAPFQTSILSRTLFLAFLLNLWLGLFNLLPAYPLDGGTIVEELLSTRLGIRRARLIVGICGVVVAALSVVVTFAAALAGIPVLLLASFAANRDAIRENWRRSPKQASQPPREQVTSSVIQFRKRGGSP